ncbi:hypothetical protein ZWY2020_046771 [Hordeum vulgare]|nr:hypothetical protein ZWY2020_046771 [Hordeum vulgare]
MAVGATKKTSNPLVPLPDEQVFNSSNTYCVAFDELEANFLFCSCRPWVSWEVFGCFVRGILAKEGHIHIWKKIMETT